MRGMSRTLILGVVALLLAPAALVAVSVQGGAAARLLLVSVTDESGRSRVDVEVDDFVVSEGGQACEVLDVHVADYPVALLLDDTAGATAWPTLRAAAERFVARIGERPVIIGTLGGDGRIVADLDVSRGEMFERLRSLAPGATATTALPALASASQLLKATESPFSAIVVVAAAPVHPDALPGYLLPQVLESGATVHVIVGGGSAGGADVLKAMSEQTRGDYTAIFAGASFGIALDRLADRLAAEMMVQYLVAPGERTGDVRVGVRRPGARVRGLGVR